MKTVLILVTLMGLTQAHAGFVFPEPLPPASKQVDVTVRICRAIGGYLSSKDIGLLKTGAYEYLPHLTLAPKDSTFDLDIIESSPDGKAVVLNRIQNGQAGAPILLEVPSLKRKMLSGPEAEALSKKFVKTKEEQFGRRRIRNVDRTFDLFSARAGKSVRFFYHGGAEYEELAKWQLERDPFYKGYGWTLEQLVAHYNHLANAFSDGNLSGSLDWDATGRTAAILLTERAEVLLFDTDKLEIYDRYRWTGGHGVALVGGESGDRYIVGMAYLGERFFERSPRGDRQQYQLQVIDRQTGEYALLAVAGNHLKKIDGTSSVIVTGDAGTLELIDVEKLTESMRDPKVQKAMASAEETEISRLSDLPPVARQVCPETRPIGR